MTLTVGSLFSGIGGIDLGLERAGMTVRWHSEIDPYACRVLKKHWPDIPNLGDITKVDWKEVPYVDVIAGGYPCQPFSLAGKRGGENDPRHLWPYFRDAISVIRPRYALLENVRGHTSLGGLSVIGDLADLGYDAEWRIVSAASVGAHHRRDRIIIVTYPHREDESDGTEHEFRMVADASGFGQSLSTERKLASCEKSSGDGCAGRTDQVADCGSTGRTRRRLTFSGINEEIRGHSRRSAAYWETEPDVGRVAHGVPARMDRLRGLGNAVVPQVAEVIGRLILEHAND